MKAAWHQFLAIMDCPRCGPAKGRTWTKPDGDGQPVIVAADPCPAHLRMLDQQGWVEA